MLMKGMITKSTGSWYKVQLDDKTYVDARLKGAMRLEGSKSTNPVAVGDFVDLRPESEGSHTRLAGMVRQCCESSPRRS